MVSLKELKQLASSATKGPWLRDQTPSPNLQIIAVKNEVIVYHGRHTRQNNDKVVDNFKFIEAADPQTILTLVEEIEKLREALYATTEDDGEFWDKKGRTRARKALADSELSIK